MPRTPKVTRDIEQERNARIIFVTIALGVVVVILITLVVSLLRAH